MRFIDKTSGATFDPTSTNWPENACVEERFVCLRIHRQENHVVAEQPKLVWELPVFLKATGNGKGLKNLLSKAINVICNRDALEDDSKLRYATWTSEDGKTIFQLPYSEI